MFKGKLSGSLLLLVLMLSLGAAASAQGTAFTYQGKLVDGGNPANGQYDLQFKLFDTATLGTGTQQGSTLIATNVTVAAGIFTVQLDFGSCPTCFDGSARFLEIAVRPNGGSFTTLSPRQALTSIPYAIKSINASQLEGQPASGFIQNSTTQQAGMTSFNIGGNGTIGGTLSAATVNATAQYSIAGLRVLTVDGPYNDGATIFTASNTFAGDGAGLNTTPDPTITNPNGKVNSYYGAGAGKANTFGNYNAFFGTQAGFRNTLGNQNAFFGAGAGQANTFGIGNAIFGQGAGQQNTTGGLNAFFGTQTGFRNTAGQNNTFVGAAADFNVPNPTGDNNTLLGAFSKVISGFSNATAIGFRAQVAQSNSLVLGSINGVNNATADTNVGIGTTAPNKHLHVFGSGDQQIGIESSDAGGRLWTLQSSQGANNGRFEMVDRTANASRLTIISTGEVGIGTTAPADKLDVNGDLRVGTGSTGCVKDSDATVIAGTCSSDARLKTNITPFPHLLDKLVQLQPVHFFWRREAFPERHFGASQSFGLIAQEVEKVLPELVSDDESGFKVIHYHKLPLLMLEAIKELKAENDALKQKLQKVEWQQQREMDALKRVVCLDHPTAEPCRESASLGSKP